MLSRSVYESDSSRELGNFRNKLWNYKRISIAIMILRIHYNSKEWIQQDTSGSEVAIYSIGYLLCKPVSTTSPTTWTFLRDLNDCYVSYEVKIVGIYVMIYKLLSWMIYLFAWVLNINTHCLQTKE